MIISTPKGLMTGREAWRQNVGGEVLAYVWEGRRPAPSVPSEPSATPPSEFVLRRPVALSSSHRPS